MIKVKPYSRAIDLTYLLNNLRFDSEAMTDLTLKFYLKDSKIKRCLMIKDVCVGLIGIMKARKRGVAWMLTTHDVETAKKSFFASVKLILTDILRVEQGLLIEIFATVKLGTEYEQKQQNFLERLGFQVYEERILDCSNPKDIKYHKYFIFQSRYSDGRIKHI